MLLPNHTITVKRWAAFATTVVSSLSVYIYEQSDEFDLANWVDGAQDTKKMMTNYEGIQTGDKVTDENSVVYIVKKVKKRESVFRKFYEVVIRKEND